MHTVTLEKTVFSFDELSEKAKEKVANWLAPDYGWWECSLDDFKESLAILGFNIDNIYFSGFSSQGDGASFTGSYSYKKGWRKALLKHFGKGEALEKYEAFGLLLQNEAKRTLYNVGARFSVYGHYSHSGTMRIDLDIENQYSQETYSDIESNILDIARDIADYIYVQLENEYYYLISEQYILETCMMNNYEFYEDGQLI